MWFFFFDQIIFKFVDMGRRFFKNGFFISKRSLVDITDFNIKATPKQTGAELTQNEVELQLTGRS